MLEGVLTKGIAAKLPASVTEVRVRRGGYVSYLTPNGRKRVEHKVSEEEFDEILSLVTERSLYAITEKLVNGYLPIRGGIRVGIAGESVMEGSRVRTVKNITSLVIRVPHQIFGIADFLSIDRTFDQNVLIVSPPACGKTTLLREIARKLSDAGKNVVILDERGEISGIDHRDFTLKIGENTDVLFGFPKRIAYENALRAMNPDYLITDELSGESDVDGVLRAYYGGVKVIATLHGESESALYGAFSPLERVFDRVLLLSDRPRVGTVAADVTR